MAVWRLGLIVVAPLVLSACVGSTEPPAADRVLSAPPTAAENETLAVIAAADETTTTQAAMIGPSVAPPIVDPEIVVVREGLPELVPIDGEPDLADLQALGPTRPEYVGAPWDVWIELTLPAAWLDTGGFVICGWTSARAFADGCIAAETFAPGIPWRFGSSSTGDDRFELWLTDGGSAGRRLLAVDPSTLGPGRHPVTFPSTGLSLTDVLTGPPGPSGNYLELE